jgi:hypothetical protein
MDDARRPLQFETAETGDAGATCCAACQGPLEATYYEIDGAPSCRPCHDRRVSAAAVGSAAGRLFRALALGTIAGVIGAGLWYGIRAATGYEVGLVSVAIGLLVGGAVRVGSRGRGGRLYQSLAVLLTYTAICSTYIPELISGFAEAEGTEATADEDSAAEDGSAGLAPWEQAIETEAAEPARVEDSEPARDEPVETAPKESRDGVAPLAEPVSLSAEDFDFTGTLASLALAFGALLLISYTVPFLLLPDNLTAHHRFRALRGMEAERPRDARDPRSVPSRRAPGRRGGLRCRRRPRLSRPRRAAARAAAPSSGRRSSSVRAAAASSTPPPWRSSRRRPRRRRPLAGSGGRAISGAARTRCCLRPRDRPSRSARASPP